MRKDETVKPKNTVYLTSCTPGSFSEIGDIYILFSISVSSYNHWIASKRTTVDVETNYIKYVPYKASFY